MGIFDQLIANSNWTPVRPNDELLYVRLFERSRDPYSYENNWAFIRQETRLGAVKYYDGEMIVTAVSRQPRSAYIFLFLIPEPSMHVPSRLVDICKEIACFTGKRVILRKVSKELLNAIDYYNNYLVIPPSTYEERGDAPEDVYPQVIIDVALTSASEGHCFMKMRNHVRSFCRQFKVSIEDASVRQRDEIEELIIRWSCERQSRPAAKKSARNGDTLVDHSAFSVLSRSFCQRIDNSHYYSKLLYANGHLVGFALAGRTSHTSAALYSSICLVGDRGASELLIMSLVNELDRGGIRYLNLGGSETGGLYSFKRKFGTVFLRSSFDIELQLNPSYDDTAPHLQRIAGSASRPQA